MRVLILGGARSGKSAYAERVCLARARARRARPVYVATAEAWDAEMADRIARHRADRDAAWTTIESPRGLGAVLKTAAATDIVLLVDCLTLWLSNEMLAEGASDAAVAEFLEAFETSIGDVVCVSNEVGLGLVPDTPLGRAFRDAQGRLNQEAAARADAVAFIAAGLPLRLKGDIEA